MEKITINVEGMTCEHCVKAVSRALKALDGVSDAKVSLKSKTASVKYDPAKVSVEKMKHEIEEQGYDVP